MGWREMGKPTTVLADHFVIERFKSMEPCHGDRSLNQRRLRKLATVLSENTFRTCSWASAICLADGKEYRINGKHTSHAMGEMNGSLPKVYVTLERYECDTLEDIADLYATFDTKTSSRSTADTNRAFAKSDDDVADIDDRAISLAAGGMVTHLGAGNRHRVSQEERGRLILRHKDFVLWVAAMFPSRTTDTSFIRRNASVAAMFATFLRSPENATEFWSEVKTGSNPERLSPSRVLQKYLMTSKGRTDDLEIYCKGIHAWNAWRRKAKTLNVLKWFPQSPRPEAL